MCWAYDPCWTKFMYGYIRVGPHEPWIIKPIGMDLGYTHDPWNPTYK